MTVTSYDFNEGAGSAFSGIVASFTDQDPRDNPVSMYSASINWGDGTISDGSIVINTDGGYLVYGTHTYGPGTFTITTTVIDNGGATAQSEASANVSDAALSVSLSPGFRTH